MTTAHRETLDLSTAVAIVGMGCRYPGANTPDELWQLVCSGREGLSRLTADQLAAAQVPAALQQHPDYVPVAGLIDNPRAYDTSTLGVSDVEADVMDPQQLLFAECAFDALDSAGHGQPGARGTVGVFAGQALPANLVDNLRHQFHPKGGGDPATSLHLHAANVQDYLPLRTAWLLGVTGPTVAIGATCATSLVAIHLAIAALHRQECDTALAGGVSLRLPQDQGYLSVPDGPFSPDGHTRPYGAGANGTVFTQGAGVVVLRRYDDAVASGDNILAVISGSAVGNDGADRAGFTAPSVAGQARIIAEAHAAAGVTPADISLIEGHGTGTAMGDPIEVAALNAVFGQADTPWCRLGSIKSVIGHADSAAGVAGLIKTVQAINHQHIPATLHVAEPNPDLPLAGSALQLAQQPGDWAGRARVAGVSAFGIGGMNAHVIVEQPPARADDTTAEAEPGNTRPPVYLLSAAAPEALRTRAAELHQVVAAQPDPGQRRHIASTLAVGHREHQVRWATTDLTRPVKPTTATEPGAQVVYAFAGGGAQFSAMAAGLYAADHTFAAALDDVATRLIALSGNDPRDIALRGTAEATDPHRGLPALFACQIAMLSMLDDAGLRPDATLGHSVGEYAAAVAAGLVTLDDACLVVSERSRLMATLPEGGMLAVTCTIDDYEAILSQHTALDIAAVNGPTAVVFSGQQRHIAAAHDDLVAKGFDARIVGVNVAAHSRMIDLITPELRQSLHGLTPHTSTGDVQYYTSMTARPVTAVAGDHWVNHLRMPVRFHDTLCAVLDTGPAVVVQVGPGSNLVALAKATGLANVLTTLTTMPPAEEASLTDENVAAVQETVAACWQHGATIDAEALCGGHRRTIALPGYPWQRREVGAPFQLPAGFPASEFDTIGHQTAAATNPATTLASHTGQRPAEEPSAADHVDQSTPPVAPQRVTADAGHPSAAQPFHLPTWHQQAPCLADSTPITVACLGADTSQLVAALDMLPHVTVTTDLTAAEALFLVDATPTGGLPAGAGSDTTAELVAALGCWADRYHQVSAAVADRTSPLPVIHLTSGAAAVLPSEETSQDPTGAAHSGMMRVLGQEIPQLTWVTIDVTDLTTQAAALVAEAATLAADAGYSGSHVAYRGHSRWLRSWTACQLPAVPSASSPRVVVVTGGLGQVARHLARTLITDHGDHVVLLARKPPAIDDDRVAGLADLTATGKLDILVADVTDATAVRNVLVDVEARHGRVDVIVHGAVVIDLVPLAELTAESLAHSVGPKVAGAVNLADAMTGLQQQPAVVVMSSAAGTIGGFGLGAYVAASRYLDAYGPAQGWTTIDWDRWKFGTDAEAATVSEVTMRHALDVADAIPALQRAMTAAGLPHTPRHLAASPDELNSRSHSLDLNRTAATSPDDAAAADQPVVALTGFQAGVAEAFAAVLGRPVTQATDDFFALGGHSLLATRVLATLRDRYGVRLALRDMLTHSNVADCAELLASSGAESTSQPELPTVSTDVSLVEAANLDVNQGRFRLNRTQHAYWVGRQTNQELGGIGCHFFLEYDCESLDVDAYQRAWQRVVDRHPMLRTVITAMGEHVVFSPAPQVVLPKHDLRHLTDAEADNRLAVLREKWACHVADPATWPLINPQVVLLPSGRSRVLLSVDVLVCDSGSWFIVDNELRQFYHDPEADIPVPAVTFADCMAYEDSQVGSQVEQEALAYWQHRVTTLPAAPNLPALPTPGPAAGQQPRFTRLTATIPADTWRQLKAQAAGWGVSTTAVVLARYAHALRTWSGDDDFSITVTVYDRPAIHPDINKVVGEFTSMMLHEVSFSTADPATTDGQVAVSAMSKAVQGRLYDDLDNRALSGLEVLSLWNRRRGSNTNVPVVFTSMLGLDDLAGTSGHDHEWLGDYVGGVSQTPQVWLDHQAFEHRGDLVLQWDVCDTVLDVSDTKAVFDAYVASFDATLDRFAPPAPATPPGTMTHHIRRSSQPDRSEIAHLSHSPATGSITQVSPATGPASLDLAPRDPAARDQTAMGATPDGPVPGDPTSTGATGSISDFDQIGKLTSIPEVTSQDSAAGSDPAAAGLSEAGLVEAGSADTAAAANGQPADGQAAKDQAAPGQAAPGQAAPGQAVPDQAVVGRAVSALAGRRISPPVEDAEVPRTITQPVAAAPHLSEPVDVADQLRSIWADVLLVPAHTITDQTFLALGGDSLLAVKMAGQIRQQLGVPLPVTAVTADVTIASLMDLIADHGAPSAAATQLEVTPRDNPAAPFGLTPLQQAYFVGQSGVWDLSYDSAHVTTDIGLAGVQAKGLQVVVQHAADQCAKEHPMLRVQVLDDGTQRFLPLSARAHFVPVTVDDLSDQPDADRQLAVKRHRLAAHGPNPRTGPGVEISITVLPGGLGRLHISSNLMVLDGISIQLFVRQLFTYLNNPATRQAPFEVDFGDYLEATGNDESNPARQRDWAWWSDRLATLPAPPAVTAADAVAVSSDTPMVMREQRISAVDWQQICDQANQREVTPSSLVLAGYAGVLAQLTGSTDFTLTTLQHHRQPVHPDVDRMLGAFSQTALVPLALPADVPWNDFVPQVHQQVAEASQHSAVSAVEVTRELVRRRGQRAVGAGVVFQSTLGVDSALGEYDFSHVAHLGDLDLGSLYQSLRTPQVALELRAFELEGQLVLSVAAVDDALRPELAEVLLQHVTGLLLSWKVPDSWHHHVVVDQAAAQPVVAGAASAVNVAAHDDCDPQAADAVAAIWHELLGCDQAPGVRDDFFALGGDSLLAIRMLARVRADLGATVDPQTFLQHPQLGVVAAAVPATAFPADGVTTEITTRASNDPTAVAGVLPENATDVMPVVESRMVGLTEQYPLVIDHERTVLELKSGAEPPIWLLHPSGGDVLCYMELARLLDTDRAICALSDPGLQAVGGVDSALMPASIDYMVAQYRQVIERRQPTGPYLIGGWSMGGTVAHHMACSWEADGIDVAGVFMLDSNSPERIVTLEQLDSQVRDDQLRLRYLRSVEAFLGLDVGHQEEWQVLQEKLLAVGAIPQAAALENRYAVFTNHLRALGEHRAAVLTDTPVLLFRADAPSPRNGQVGMGVDDTNDRNLGWNPLVNSDLRVRATTAHHYSIVQQPAILRVAEEVSRFVTNSTRRK